MDKKESKKGFWSTLFAPKKKSSCCCNSNIIVDEDVKPVQSCGCSDDSTEAAETSCCATAPGVKVSEVLVLGPGCAKCKETYKVVERVISENNRCKALQNRGYRRDDEIQHHGDPCRGR